jgi:GTP-binding protein
MFWDSLEIKATAGSGGNGVVSFRTEYGESKGGPDGGDGGRGGSILMVASDSVNTLAAYARNPERKAPSGKPGAGSKRHGKSGENLLLKVPVGTMVYEGDELVADLSHPEDEALVARGGIGGFGNAHFTSSVRQVPRQAELGEPGEEKTLRLELKLVADIGLVGVPSAGKSTLLSSLTAAKPKIADYPFTTTIPQLGIAEVDGRRVALADIPGLIEGAHQGKGLGDAFLRHIERTKAIVHLVDATAPDPAANYRTIRSELESFNPALAEKPEVVALNKTDAIGEELTADLQQDLEKRLKVTIIPISAVTGAGVRELLRVALTAADTYQPPESEVAGVVIRLADLAPDAVSISATEDGYLAKGSRLERLAKQTDFSNPEAVRRFWWVFERLGAAKQLEKLGAPAKAPVTIAGQTHPWPGL